jgi:hypothetical protein
MSTKMSCKNTKGELISLTETVVANMKEEEKLAWLGLREIYRLVGSPDGNNILRQLLKEEPMRTSELIAKSGIPSGRLHVLMKALVLCLVVDRKVHDDRGVSYNISPFGRHVLKLSEPILDTIKEAVKDKDSALLALIERKG